MTRHADDPALSREASGAASEVSVGGKFVRPYGLRAREPPLLEPDAAREPAEGLARQGEDLSDRLSRGARTNGHPDNIGELPDETLAAWSFADPAGVQLDEAEVAEQ